MDTLLTALGPSAPVRTLTLSDTQTVLASGLFKSLDPPIGPLENGPEYTHEQAESWGIVLSRALDEQRIYRSVAPTTASSPHVLREFLGASPTSDITEDQDLLEKREAVLETGPNAQHYTWIESLADFLLDCEGFSVESVGS